MRRALPVRLAVILVSALVLGAGCAQADDPPASVEVSGEPGAAPVLTFPAPLEVDAQRVEVLAEGDGPELVDGAPVLLDFLAESAQDGSVIAETYSGQPRAFTLTAESLGPDLYQALQSMKVGARLLQVAPGRDGYPAAVAVYDVLPTRATGEQVPPRAGLPTVTLAVGGEPTISVPAAEPPTGAVVQPLIRGAGPQVAPGEVITVQYVGVTWSDGTVFDSTWASGRLPADLPIGVGSVPEGWDEGLVEQTVGSQVLLVLPPGEGGDENGLGDQTLVYVVDILAASGGPEGG